jgi:spoIIIJ-associated protein
VEWVETTGRTVEEAKALALEQLGVGEGDAEFEVLADAKVGFFGRLKEEARVRARVRPRYPRAKVERRDHRRRGSQEEARPNLSRAATQPLHQPTGYEDGGVGEHQVGPAATPATPQGERGPQGGRRRRRDHRPAATTKRGSRAATVAAVGPVSAEEQGRIAETFLRGFIERLGLAATITSSEDAEGPVVVDVTGDGLGFLIGPRGTTLSALQELTRIVVQRQAGPSDSRVVLDINGYRKRRQEALSRFARDVAEQVRQTGKKRALEPMPPADRKVVHDAVNAVEGVTTISEGEEPYRRVVLVPTAAPGPEGQPSQLTGEEPSGEEAPSASAAAEGPSLEPTT